jgi:hypothetical protein
MVLGANLSSAKPLPVRVITSTTLGVVGGGTHIIFSWIYRSLVWSQDSRNTGSGYTPISPGVEPTNYPFHSVNEYIPLETILDNPVQD